MRILTAVGQTLVRDALRKLLEERGHEVVAQAASGLDAVELARTHRPDVALLDLLLSRRGIMAAARVISAELPSTAVVVLSAEPEDGAVLEALSCGAKGFLTRDLDGPAFCRMLERAGAGELVITSAHAGRLIRGAAASPSVRRWSRWSRLLTPRERDVMAEMACGHTSNRDLARVLQLSENTVRFHVRNILEKLGQHSRAAAVAYAFTHGISERHEAR